MKRTKEFWTQIEKDRSDGMTLPDVCVKYDITRGIIKRARTDGKLNDVRDRPAKRNWDIIQNSIDDIGVDATLVMYNITIISLYSAKQRGKVSWKPRKPKKVIDLIDWQEMQIYYNDNHSTTDIIREFCISSTTITQAVKMGLLKLRGDKDRQRLSR